MLTTTVQPLHGFASLRYRFLALAASSLWLVVVGALLVGNRIRQYVSTDVSSNR
jgi:hypothetical protein